MSKFTTLQDLPNVLDEMLGEYQKESFFTRQKAVETGAEMFKREIEAATPKSDEDGIHMADLWVIKERTRYSKYVTNTKAAKGSVHRKKKDGSKGEARTGVPLSNVLEYAENSPHQGFIRRCFDQNEQKIYEAMKKIIENGG